MLMDFFGTLVLKVDPDNPDRELIAYAARIVRDGGIVAFPTETVYGLAVNLFDSKAVERLYKVKRRLGGKPSTVHIASLKEIETLGCRLTKKALRLAERFWPGPLTIILRSKNGKRVGFRMPANNVALRLISASGVSVIAPSANISGKNPPKSASGVLRDLDGKIDLLLDAGRTKVGIESTVIDISSREDVILREGAIKSKVLLRALNSR